MTNTSFRDYLREYLDIKGVSVKKLADSTNILERHLEALLEGNGEALPPTPYVLGYIEKLAEVLEFDKEEMWRLYKRDNRIDNFGVFDRLPDNRYAIKKINKKMLVSGGIGALLLIYFLWNFNNIWGTPPLQLSYPTAENLIVHQPTISLEGRTAANAKLTINGKETLIDEDGRFQEKYPLSPGLNVITITAKKLLSKTIIAERKIIYEPPPQLTIDERQSTINKSNEQQQDNQ